MTFEYSSPAPITRLIEAADLAELWARSLKIGNKFIGAAPEAELRGFSSGTPEYRVFIDTALLHLPEIYVDEQYIITKLESTKGSL